MLECLKISVIYNWAKRNGGRRYKWRTDVVNTVILPWVADVFWKAVEGCQAQVREDKSSGFIKSWFYRFLFSKKFVTCFISNMEIYCAKNQMYLDKPNMYL